MEKVDGEDNSSNGVEQLTREVRGGLDQYQYSFVYFNIRQKDDFFCGDCLN